MTKKACPWRLEDHPDSPLYRTLIYQENCEAFIAMFRAKAKLWGNIADLFINNVTNAINWVHEERAAGRPVTMDML